MPQPDFAGQVAKRNVSFRIPPPLFGLGLIETIPDSIILANRDANREAKQRMGVRGKPNRDQRDGSITRFGWKAQARSLEQFTAEAYLIEQGVTSELFPAERGNPQAECTFNATPEDRKYFFGERLADSYSNVTRIAHFLRFLAPPVPFPDNDAIKAGREIFDRIGCALCHTPELTTGMSSYPSLSERRVPLYSDLLLHQLGSTLSDEIVQGDAGPAMFRTAALWGLGKRIFFLHDGRTKDLVEAIAAHADTGSRKEKQPSEGNASVKLFFKLSDTEKQRLLDFLRSL